EDSRPPWMSANCQAERSAGRLLRKCRERTLDAGPTFMVALALRCRFGSVDRQDVLPQTLWNVGKRPMFDLREARIHRGGKGVRCRSRCSLVRIGRPRSLLWRLDIERRLGESFARTTAR